MTAPRDNGDTEEHQLIRDAVRKVCAGFPDEYWAACDAEQRFPWDFYHAMAAAGCSMTAAPAAVATRSPFFVKTQPVRRRSLSSGTGSPMA